MIEKTLEDSENSLYKNQRIERNRNNLKKTHSEEEVEEDSPEEEEDIFKTLETEVVEEEIIGEEVI